MAPRRNVEKASHKPDGYFDPIKEQWYCACKPPQPAIQLRARMDGDNPGRLYFRCRIPLSKGLANRPQSCQIFLWSDEAQKREKEAQISNNSAMTPRRRLVQTTLKTSRSPGQKAESTSMMPVSPEKKKSSTLRAGSVARAATALEDETTDSDSSSDEDGPPNKVSSPAHPKPTGTSKAVQNQSPGSLKRKRPQDDDDDYGLSWDTDEERQLVEMTDSVAAESCKKSTVFATPSTSRACDARDGMVTPLTGKSVSRMLFQPETPAPRRGRMDESGGQVDARCLVTPSTAQKPAAGNEASTTDEVLGLLKGQGLSEDRLREVCKALEKCDRKVQGLTLGRDAARKALAESTEKVAKLQETVAQLQESVAMSKRLRRRERRAG